MTDLATLVLAVDSSQVKQGDAALTSFGATSKKTEQAVASHAATTKTLTTSLRDQASVIATLQGPLGGIASRFSSLGSVISEIGPLGGIAAVGITALSVAAEKAVTKFAELQQQQFTIAAVLRATGNASGQTAAGIDDLAVSIADATLATGEQARAAAATLLTFRAVSGDTFTQTLKLAQDLAAVGFGDINTAARALGRTLQDPLNGMQALRREGIVFSAAQKQQVKDFMDVGNVAAAQKVILDQVQASVGGAGAAQAGGLTGAWHSMTEAT